MQEINHKELAKKALEIHKKHTGKIEVVSKFPVKDELALSLAYTPGVAEPCKEINKNPDDVYSSRWCEGVSSELTTLLNDAGENAQAVSYRGWDITSHEAVVVNGKTLVDATWQQFLDKPDKLLPKVMVTDIDDLEDTLDDLKIPEKKRHIWRSLAKKSRKQSLA